MKQQQDYTVEDIDNEKLRHLFKDLVTNEMSSYLRELELEEKYEDCAELKGVMDYLGRSFLGYEPLDEAEPIYMMWVQLLCRLVEVFPDGESFAAMYATSGGPVCFTITMDEYVALSLELARRKLKEK